MPFDPQISDLIAAEIITGQRRGSDLNGVIDRSLVQQLGVIGNTVIQSQAATADDAQLFAAMRTAPYVPHKDA